MTLSQQRTREQINELVQPLQTAGYGVDHEWRYLERAIEGYGLDFGLNLEPDFQRGHVWSREQQQHYIENFMRGVIPHHALLVQFNCPHWDEHDYAGELPREMQCIDGLQRLTAIRQFMAGKVTAFGLTLDGFAGSEFDAARRGFFRVRWEVHTFSTRRDLLQHYLAINSGGTPHAPSELDRVRGLLDASEKA